MQTLSALEGSHSALSNIYMNQASVYASKPAADKQVLPATLLADHTYKTVYMLIKARLSRKGERDPTLDPQRNTIKDTYDADELLNIINCLMSKGTAETDRALAMAMWSHSSVGRSDDVRLFYLADLITPQYIPAVGECRHQLMQLSGSSFSGYTLCSLQLRRNFDDVCTAPPQHHAGAF